MAVNQHVNKVVFGSATLVDLTGTTATADKILQGYGAYGADGAWMDGTATSSGTAAISVVDTTDSHGGTIRTITGLDISDTTAVASDVATGKYFYTANGTKTAGTASGGTPSVTHHVIHFDFTDSTDTDIDVYYDDSLIGNMITSYEITTYNNKTISVAELDGVTYYIRPTGTWQTLWSGNANSNPDTPYNYFWIADLSNIYLTVGDQYRVTIDGTTYTLVAANSGTSYGVMIGNPKYSGGSDNGSTAPFNLFNAGWGAWSGDTELQSGRSYNMKIEKLVIA